MHCAKLLQTTLLQRFLSCLADPTESCHSALLWPGLLQDGVHESNMQVSGELCPRHYVVSIWCWLWCRFWCRRHYVR